MLSLLTIAGGVALLLFGVRFLRKGLDRLFGNRLGGLMNRLAATPVAAFCSGLMTSVVAPSSTTISLLAVQTVQAGLMSARQMLVVMLGANIGLTVLVQLMALELDSFAPIVVLIGVILFQYTQQPRSRGIGQVVLSFGFVFLAMGMIRDAVVDSDFTSSQDFVQLMDIVQRYPIALALMAGGLAIVLQSSTVTIALLIGLSTGTQISLAIALPVVLGANVGLGFTTLIVAWRQIESRRLALANLMLKTTVAAIVFGVAQALADTLPEPKAEHMALVVANLHTGFNVIVAAIGLPAVGITTRLVKKLVPEPPNGAPRAFGPKFIHDGPIGGMALSMGQSLREIMHMGEIIRGMLDDVWIALKTSNEPLAREVAERDDQVDELDRAIKRFLTRLVKEEVDDFAADEQMRQLRCLSELETVGDIIDKNLAELALKKIRLRAEFSANGERELDTFYGRVVENMEIAVTAFAGRDRRLAHELLRHQERLDHYDHELRGLHFERLNAGEEGSLESSSIHLDLLTHLKRINSALTAVGTAILEGPEATDRE